MSENNWHWVASVGDVAPDYPTRVVVEGRAIALYNVAGTLYATSDVCTHAEASLCDGFQEGSEIECPLHESRFDIPTGKVLSPPATEDLQTFEVRVNGDDVLLRMESK